MSSYSLTAALESRWIPASRNVPRANQKLMIVLHGRGDSMTAYGSIKQELKLPYMNYLLLNAPRRFQGGYSWYSLEPNHHKGVKDARERLFKLVAELKKQGWKSHEIYWLGHSQGCLVAADLVLNHPDAFGGVVGVSGYVWFFRGWETQVKKSGALRTPWLLTHGRHDRIIRPCEIREDVEHLTRGKVPVLYREFAKGHDFDFREEVPFIRTWLRGSARLSIAKRNTALVRLTSTELT